MWFKFKKGEPKGKLRVKQVQVAWYDMERNGDCFDESWILHKDDGIETLKSIGMWLPYVETVEDEGNPDRSRVFVHMDNGDVYELLMKKLSEKEFEQCSNFNGGKKNE